MLCFSYSALNFAVGNHTLSLCAIISKILLMGVLRITIPILYNKHSNTCPEDSTYRKRFLKLFSEWLAI
ncbi:hypothetical protein G9A89_001613 [Geosiphon pyriformis]|nr:hypothetical protein G9A89_001613 [Geosiphon pyriformis]